MKWWISLAAIAFCFLLLLGLATRIAPDYFKRSYDSEFDDTVLSIVDNRPVSFNPVPTGFTTTYVPVYSHIYGGQGKAVGLSVSLSLRNLSTVGNLIVHAVSLIDTDGRPAREYVAKPLIIPPLGTKEYFIREKDRAGGSGSNFIVVARGDGDKHRLLAESVMLGHQGNQGFSFVSRGVEIEPQEVQRAQK